MKTPANNQQEVETSKTETYEFLLYYGNLDIITHDHPTIHHEDEKPIGIHFSGEDYTPEGKVKCAHYLTFDTIVEAMHEVRENYRDNNSWEEKYNKLLKSYTILENAVRGKYPEVLEETLRNQKRV